MKRRWLSIFVCIAFALTNPITCLSEGIDADVSGVKTALLMDADSGKIVLEKSSTEPHEFAGLVRLAPLLLVCTAFDEGRLMDETSVTVSGKAAQIKGQTAFVSENEVIAAGELIKAAVILLAGDAIYALIQTAYGSDANALEALSAICPVQYSDIMGQGMLLTAVQVSELALRLVQSPTYLKYSSTYMDTVRHANAPETELVNPNRLVRHYSGCFGLATGSVGSNEYAGAFIVNRGTTTLLAIVGGAATSDARFATASAMLDTGFAMYRSAEISKAGEVMGFVAVNGGVQLNVMAVTASRASALLPVTDTRLESEIKLMEEIEAPVMEGQELGVLLLKNSKGEVLGEISIVAAYEVERAVFDDYFYRILEQWLIPYQRK